MVPVIAASGGSFKGAHAYYFHDKNALSTERVSWTHTVNMLTDCAEKAWKVMAYTAKNQTRLKEASGRRTTRAKSRKPVFAYSLSWHPEQTPDREAMLSAVRASLEKLGLDEHQAMIAAHTDEPQPHVHIVVNTVHPMTGLVAKLKFTKRRLSDFAREYQKEEGTIYCPRREENYQKRQKGVSTKYVDPIILKAWESTTDGDSFAKALKIDGYQLAQGRKRIVIIDRNGKTVNPLRHLQGVSSREFKAQFSAVFREDIPMADEAIQCVTLANTDRTTDKPRHPAAKHNERSLRVANQITALISAQEFSHAKERDQLIAQHFEAVKDITTRSRIDDIRTAILTLQHKLAKQGFWKRLFRLDRIFHRNIETLNSSLTQATIRLGDEIEFINVKFSSKLDEIKLRQTKEREILITRLKARRPAHRDKSNPRAIGSEKIQEQTQSAVKGLDLGR